MRPALAAARSSTAWTAQARSSTSSGEPWTSSSPASIRAVEVGVEPEDAVDAEDVGDEVVGEGGEAVEAGEVGDAGAVEVGGGELGALEEGTSRPS